MGRWLALLRFDGRLSRLGYWRAYLLLAIAGALVWCIGLFAILGLGPIGALLLLPMPAVIVATVAIAVRRLHDRGKSGWWVLPLVAFPLIWSAAQTAQTPLAMPAVEQALVSLVSLGLSIWGLVEIGFRRGVSGENRYGRDPLLA